MRYEHIVLPVITLIASVLVTATSACSPDTETSCYSGISLLTGPDGTPHGTKGQLFQRTLDPANSQIIERIVAFDSPVGEPPSEVSFTSVVEGNTFSLSFEGREGNGQLVGDPWEWTSWISARSAPGGILILSETERTPAGLFAITMVLDESGTVMHRVEDTLTTMDCALWEGMTRDALTGELHVTDMVTGTDEVETVETSVAYREQEVTLDAGGRAVHGTITYPTGEGPFAAVMLIAGSGPTDRDWNNPYTPGTNGSARLLAHVLAENGYLVLRYDKMGIGESTEMPPEFSSGESGLTLEHIMAEQIAGIRHLEDDPLVDSSHIFVGGSSEGGIYALRLAEEADLPLAGIMTLAGAGRPQRIGLVQQVRDRLTEARMHTLDEINIICAQLATALGGLVETGAMVDPATVTDVEGVQELLAAYMDPHALQWARWMLSYDPCSAFAGFEIPVLIINGEKDRQVSPELDARRMYQAALAAGRTNVTLAIVPNADHVLKYEETPVEELTAMSTLRYNVEGRHLDPDAVEAILRWLQENTAAD